MELQQSPLYLYYIQKLGWKVTSIDGVFIIHRNFFLYGGLAKLQRSDTLPDTEKFITFITSAHIRSVAIEPSPKVTNNMLTRFCRDIAPFVKINRNPFLPTKTLFIDITKSEDEIFKNFTEAKRRAVRRAQKNGVKVRESTNISEMIRVKNKSAGFLGSITTYGLLHLSQTFTDKHTAILLAYKGEKPIEPIAGVFLIFLNKTAYYWIVGALREGKKLFAPTLLVWEALRLAKKRNCGTFDFVGVWDERMPKINNEWLGFTKFKEGFGGRIQYYPIAV